MYRYVFLLGSLGWSATILSGCAQSTASPPPAVSAASPEYQLSSEPEGAIEVLDAKDQAKNGDPIVVVGRVGGGINPWIEGRAAFLVVDTRILPSCDLETCDENCPDCAKEMAAASAMVKVLNADGKVVPVDARQLLGIKNEQTVVVSGIANRDETGNVTIAAKGIYVRK